MRDFPVVLSSGLEIEQNRKTEMYSMKAKLLPLGFRVFPGAYAALTTIDAGQELDDETLDALIEEAKALFSSCSVLHLYFPSSAGKSDTGYVAIGCANMGKWRAAIKNVGTYDGGDHGFFVVMAIQLAP